ncbi:MAG: hypothetical protein ACTFAL_05275 [Candidatus Electronema sp. V4]|uniref:hypothetical protein n=1 Tax=Candidatus Electronema sp. V4 TaxID=3454756 RepID=UPI00405560EF
MFEHLFISAILKHLWQNGPIAAEVMKPQVDDAGYDIIIEVNSVLRHIQLKSSFIGAKTRSQKIHLQLRKKTSGCVIWICFDRDTLKLGPFLWLGGEPGKPLPDISNFKVARHTKGDATGRKAERPMLRVVPKGRFREIKTITELVEVLFGDIKQLDQPVE